MDTEEQAQRENELLAVVQTLVGMGYSREDIDNLIDDAIGDA